MPMISILDCKNTKSYQYVKSAITMHTGAVATATVEHAPQMGTVVSILRLAPVYARDNASAKSAVLVAIGVTGTVEPPDSSPGEQIAIVWGDSQEMIKAISEFVLLVRLWASTLHKSVDLGSYLRLSLE